MSQLAQQLLHVGTKWTAICRPCLVHQVEPPNSPPQKAYRCAFCGCAHMRLSNSDPLIYVGVIAICLCLVGACGNFWNFRLQSFLMWSHKCKLFLMILIITACQWFRIVCVAICSNQSRVSCCHSLYNIAKCCFSAKTMVSLVFVFLLMRWSPY